MVFIPYQRFIIKTNLDIDETVRILSMAVEPKISRVNAPSVNRKRFVGTVSKDRFNFIRNVSYLNSFLPTIKGIFDSSLGKTRLMVTMTGNLCVLLSITATFSFFGYFLLTVLMGLIPGFLVITGSLAIGASGYLIYTLLFSVESKADRFFLTKMFSSE